MLLAISETERSFHDKVVNFHRTCQKGKLFYKSFAEIYTSCFLVGITRQLSLSSTLVAYKNGPIRCFLIYDGSCRFLMMQAEGLLVEMNMSSCYEMIEKFCECISANLSTMDKQMYVTFLSPQADHNN